MALTDVALSNVEALAGCETTAGSCWMDVNYKCFDAGNSGCSPCGH